MKALGFGAVLWDEIEDRLNIGGAVFNLMAHLQRLGAKSAFITAVGNDELGVKTCETMQAHGVDASFTQVVDVPTCVVKVSVDANGVPVYTIPEHTSWDLIKVKREIVSAVNRSIYDYVCFGTIEQRNHESRGSLRALLEKCTFKHVFLDLNLRLHFYTEEVLRYSLQACSILKLNEEEATEVAVTFNFDIDYEALAHSLHKTFGIELVCITEGERGAFLWSPQESVYCRGYSVSVKDTVGSGDAFSAGLLHGHYNGLSLYHMGDFACRLGALVASKTGAIPRYSRDEVAMLMAHDP